MEAIVATKNNLRKALPSRAHGFSLIENLNQEFNEWFVAKEDESKVDELDVTLRDYRISHSFIITKHSSNENETNKLDTFINYSDDNNIARRGRIYGSNSACCESCNECDIESPVERATKALSFNRIKESSTKDDLDITLRCYALSPALSRRNRDTTYNYEKGDLLDVTMRGYMVVHRAKLQKNEYVLSKSAKMELAKYKSENIKRFDSLTQRTSIKKIIPSMA